MRRPGTLPVANNASGHRVGIGGGMLGGGGGCGPGGLRDIGVDDGSTPVDRLASTGARSHYSSHSLRRTPHSQPQLSAREAADAADRTMRTMESGLVQNGVPLGGRHQPSPPPLPSRHQPTCGQSSYPTLPVNGHAAHHHHHHAREGREKERSATRERNRDREAAGPGGGPPPPPLPAASQRSDKHREVQMEMELRESLDISSIGTYRA